MFGLDDCFGFRLREMVGQYLCGQTSMVQYVMVIKMTSREGRTHSQRFIPSRCGLWVCALLGSRQVLLLLLLERLGISTGHLSIRRTRYSATTSRETERSMRTHDLAGIARVAETENARTGALKADRKMLVDCDSMLIDVWSFVWIERIAVRNRLGVLYTRVS